MPALNSQPSVGGVISSHFATSCPGGGKSLGLGHCISFFLFFKVFIEFVTILLLFYVSVFWPGGMWDLSSATRDPTHNPCL